jgi:nitrite reductase (NADH) small subunit
MAEVMVATTDEVEEGSGKIVEVGDKSIALFRVGDEFHAIENTCPHRGGSLGDGFVDGEKITCPLHGWQFKITSGEGVSPSEAKINSFPVEVRGEEIFIEV